MLMQGEIPELGQAFAWLPDETLFSLVSRYHLLSGAMHPWITCERLFGHRLRGSAHDFPSRLDEFASRSHGAVGDARQLALERTLLSFYLPWRTSEAGDQALAALRGSGVGSLKFMLGLLTSRFGAQNPLKACARCMAQDLEKFRVSYWRRCHQWPGVWTCADHGDPLLVSGCKVDGQDRYAWVLPAQAKLACAHSPWRSEATSAEKLRQRLARLTDMVFDAVKLPAGALSDTGRLSAAYRSQMVHLGWLKRVDHLKWNALEERFRGHLESVAGLSEFARLIVGPRALRSHLSLLLYAPRAHTHPLRHLLMIETLFPDWRAFTKCFLGISNVLEDRRADLVIKGHARSANTSRAPTTDPIPTQSAREFARNHGVDVNTALAWRAAAGLAPTRRAKTLKPPILRQLIADLRAGMAKRDAARAAGVSVTSVTRILRTEPGLQASWHQQCWRLRQQESRNAWTSLLETHPGMFLRLLRLQAPGPFAWLYRNDRDWLNEQMQLREACPITGNNVLAKWRGKDEHLALEVRRAAIWLDDAGQLSLAGLCSAVPELVSHLRRLDRLPVTQRVMLSVLR